MKTVNELAREPDMRETGAGLVITNVLYHVGAFINERVKSTIYKCQPAETAMDIVKDIKHLIEEYESVYGKVE